MAIQRSAHILRTSENLKSRNVSWQIYLRGRQILTEALRTFYILHDHDEHIFKVSQLLNGFISPKKGGGGDIVAHLAYLHDFFGKNAIVTDAYSICKFLNIRCRRFDTILRLIGIFWVRNTAPRLKKDAKNWHFQKSSVPTYLD